MRIWKGIWVLPVVLLGSGCLNQNSPGAINSASLGQVQVELPTPTLPIASQVLFPVEHESFAIDAEESLPSPTPSFAAFAKVPVTAFAIQTSNLRQEDLVTKIDVCFSTPGGEDWQINSATFQLVGQVFPIVASTPEELQPPSLDYPEGYRCETIEFNIPPGENPILGTLTIHSIAEVLGEGKGCLKYAEEVQTALSQRSIPIEFTCQEDHGYSLEVVATPPFMSSDQALHLLTSFYIIEGDWEFSFHP